MTRRTVLLALLVSTATLVAVPARACAVGFPAIRFDGYLGNPSSRVVYPVPESSSSAPFGVALHTGCGGPTMSVDYATSGGTATPGADYTPESDTVTFPSPGFDQNLSQTLNIAISQDMEIEPAAVEWTNLVLSNPVQTSLAPPSTAGLVIIDDDGTTSRVGLEGVAYSQLEAFGSVQIPVFRAGSTSSSHTVGYTLTPGPGAPATPGQDVTPASGSVTIPGGQRWAMINLTLTNDTFGEETEEFTLTLDQGSPASMTVTIVDNDEGVKPTSRFHHPRNGWRYKKSDFRIREVHVFADDNLGKQNVVAVDFALRRNLKNKACVWLTKSGWQKKDCQNREWLVTKYDPTGELWWFRLKQLKSSVGTKIKNYTAFARAIDSAQNVESQFNEKRNANTFEVKRSKPKR
jgi:Calx-beta domain